MELFTVKIINYIPNDKVVITLFKIDKTADTIYRYESLLQAIDFFTQRFTLEQLSLYAFKFSHELLNLKACALFIKNQDTFSLKITKSYEYSEYHIDDTEHLQNIATFHGNIIMNKFENFFKKEDLEKFNVKLVIPLIIDEFLYGFILSDGSIHGIFDEDDYILSYSFMRLVNNALENIKHFSDLQTKNKQLDQKIFNLFAINHSAKTLLSQIDLQKLYAMATDIFSEITCSKVTSFGIYDHISNKIQILGYRNVSDFSKYYTELHLHTNTYNDKIVLHFDSDLEIIKSIFVNWEEFVHLDTKYIVLLVKDNIVGLVTLSESVNDCIYDTSTFELIESLASFAYIALSNALLFQKINMQKESIERKFNALSKLNNLVKNINHCTTVNELCALTLKALHLSFGIQKGFIALKKDSTYSIEHSLGISIHNQDFKINKNWENSFAGETIYDFSSHNLNQYFSPDMIYNFDSANCMILSPITLETSYLYDTSSPMGYLVILETKNSLQEEEILLIDTISKNISPVIHQMNLVANLKENYIEDSRKKFLKNLQNKIEDREKYLIPFHLYYKVIYKHPFQPLDLSAFYDFDCYIIDHYLFVLTYDDLNLNHLNLKELEPLNQIEDVLNFDYK